MNKKLLLIISGILMFIIFFSGSVFFKSINYEYQLSKCNNMNSQDYEYNFDNDIQINAEYVEDCYRLNNYPYYKFLNIYLNSFMTAFLLSILICSLIGLLHVIPI